MSSVRLSVTVPEDLARALETERDLFGFDSREAYVRWLLEHRDSIEVSPPSADVEAGAGDRGTGEAGAGTDAGLAPDPPADAGSGAGAVADATTGADAGADASTGAGAGADEPDEATPTPVADGDGAAAHSHNLSPGVARIPDDEDVDAAAAELGTVERERLDEFARRAVARTRRRLGDAGTGIEYDSRTAIDDGPPPGADLTDLDALDLPGYDEELLARRRRAVGAALAYLKEAGEARRSEFLDALYDEYPAGYESADGWWSCVKRGLGQVDRVDGAGGTGPGSRTWRYRDYRGRVHVASED